MPARPDLTGFTLRIACTGARPLTGFATKPYVRFGWSSTEKYQALNEIRRPKRGGRRARSDAPRQRGGSKTEISVDPKTSRRSFLGLAIGAPIAGATLAACGSSGPTRAGGSSSGGGGGGGGAATYWFLSGQPDQSVREDTVKRFNSSNSGGQITYTEFQNDAYKTKIKTALGAGQGPTIIWGWGGGGLRDYVKTNQVEDLTSWFEQNPEQKSRRFASSFQAATVDGKIYAVPGETVTPIVMFWNKKVLDKIWVSQIPQDWNGIMQYVQQANSKGVAPFSLGGQSRWTNMMWLEFLLDRIG